MDCQYESYSTFSACTEPFDLTSVMMCVSPVLLAPLAEEEVEVGSLREGQEEVLLERLRQRRLASFIDQTEVIELMVYVDKLLYDRYKENKTHVERHILAIMNLVCACMCIHVCVCVCTYVGVCVMCEICNV